MRLTHKIILYLSALLLIISTGLSLIFYFNLLEVSKDRAIARISHINDVKMQVLTEKLQHLINTTQTLEQTPPVSPIVRSLLQKDKIDPITGESLEIWQDQLEKIFTGVLKSNSRYMQIRFISKALNGHEFIRVEKQGDKVIVNNQRQDKSGRDYYQQGLLLKKGEVSLSPIQLNKEFGKIQEPHIPVIRAVIPVYLEGQSQGVIVVNKNMTEYLKDLGTVFEKQTHSILFDHRDNYLFHPTADLTFQKDLNPNHSQAPRPPKHWLVKRSLASQETKKYSRTFEENGQISHLNVFHYNPSDPKDFLALVTETSLTSISTGPKAVMTKSLLALLLFFLLALPILYLLGRQFAEPILKFNHAIDQYVHQGSKVQLDPKSFNSMEFSELATSFEHMIQTIDAQKLELVNKQKQLSSQEKFAALGVLSAGIAHEVNNPLAVLKCYTDSLRIMIEKNNCTSEGLEKIADRFDLSITRIRDIIEGLRSLSRDNDSDNFSPVDLKKTLTLSQKFVTAQSPAYAKYLSLEFPETIPQVLGRSGPLSQVFVNLMSNACYEVVEMDNPWVKASIESDDDFVYIKVRDSGKISKIRARKVMDPFYTTKPEGQGTGLGLSISHNIVEKHNGELYVDLDEENTCFVVKLPKITS